MVGRSLKACNLWTSQPVSQSASQPECVDYFGRPSASRLWRQSVKFTGEPQRGRFKGRSHRQAHTATAAPNTDSTILLNPSPALHHHSYIFTLSRSRNISATMANLFNSARTAFRAAVNGSAASVRNASTQAGANASQSFVTSRSSAIAATAVAAGSVAWYNHLYGTLPFLDTASANMADEGLHPPKYPWSHSGVFETFDHASIRRGYQVYREVCSSCHSLDRIAWRNLVGQSHTVDEAKAMAEEVEYEDGPDDEGAMFQRPGKLADYMPRPYANDEAARAANAGALPPDLSLMVKARHGGADYIFALLTGYTDPPAGVKVQDGLNYNSYFPGTQIAMARVLYDGLVDYEDGTPATTSQMAKDVVTFLHFCAEPEHDTRKKMGMQAVIILSSLTALSIWVKRFKWAGVKNRKLVYNPPTSTH